ncbi:MAG: RsmB/NOP family class I SAM-dependent RNA methyltransferase [Candidatus Hodarchaeota archaeon]
MAEFLYATYRIIHEKSSITTILSELPNLETDLMFLDKLYTFSWKIALQGKKSEEKLSIRLAIPRFLINHLKSVMDSNFLQENLRYLNDYNKNRKIYFRINSLADINNPKTLIKTIKSDYQESSIKLAEDPDIPELYYTLKKSKRIILENRYYREGKIIFQDKASATVIYLLHPQPNELICDLCAAPGIKTSLIAQYSKNKARICANDISFTRLSIAQQLLTKLYVKNTLFINTDSINAPIRHDFLFDKILIDAPCTGSGALLTHPELKWRQSPQFLHQNVILQDKLIHQGLELLKPGGIMLYSTCSLYPEEGELQIMKYLDNLEPLEIPKWLSPCYQINNTLIEGTGRLFPSIHNTQGFFIAKFKKKPK